MVGRALRSIRDPLISIYTVMANDPHEIAAKGELMDVAEFCWFREKGGQTFLPDGTMKMLASAHPFRVSTQRGALGPGIYYLPVQFRPFNIHSEFPLSGVSIKVFGLHRALRAKAMVYGNNIKAIRPSNALVKALMSFTAAGNAERAADLWAQLLLKGHVKTNESEELREWVNCIMDSYGDVRIGEIAQRNGVSRQLLHRTFKKNTGITPKQLATIWRMNKFLISGSTGFNLTYWAHEAGYFDQAHCIHEVHRFSGLAPTEALKSKALRANFRHIRKRLSDGYAPPL